MLLRAQLKRIAPLKAAVHRLRALDPNEYGYPAGHYYSPIPARADLRACEARIWSQPPCSLPGIDTNVAEQLALLNRLTPAAHMFSFPAKPTSGYRYWMDNAFFGHHDGLMLYALLTTLHPLRYIEVGSGYSSALVLDTNERKLAGHLACTFIEPYPGRLLSLLTPLDRERVTLLEQPVQDVPLSTFAQLAADDILFIDSSHVSKTGSDVNWLVFEVLPRLASGVYVHFHDMQWPFEYPKVWVMKGRAWNEAYLVRALLQDSACWEIALWPHYLSLFHLEAMQAALPGYAPGVGGSLWLRKR